MNNEWISAEELHRRQEVSMRQLKSYLYREAEDHKAFWTVAAITISYLIGIIGGYYLGVQP